MIYPLAYLALTSALTVVLLAVGLAGQAAMAAELAVIQGALLATFYAFSANTRSLILQGHGDLTPERLLAKRVVALPLLGVASYVLCVVGAGVSPLLALLLIARRACEWLVEVRLCEMEVAAERGAARRALLVQAAVTLGAAAMLALAPSSAVPVLTVFAVSPLFSALPRFRAAAFGYRALAATLRGATPHIGSTAIEGISTYVLRLVVFFVAGREASGLLFTAFVLGSFVATLFANVLGPSLALQRARARGGRLARLAPAVPAAMALAGLALAVAALATGLPDALGKPGEFWLALGFSLLGGAVMIAAQTIRLRLFDERRAEVLFGADVLRNLSAIIAAPTLHYLVGPPALGALYFATAMLTLFFYWGARRHLAHELSAPRWAAMRGALAAMILLPLFFLLSGGVYHSPGGPVLDPGNLMGVPLPLSLATCFAGLVLLARYRHAVLSLGVIFFLFVLMVFTSIVASDGDIAYESRKFLLLFQFLVPAFGLVLGQMFGAPRQGLALAATGFALVLVVLVPAQLVHSIGYGENELRHDLWVFSVYQHLQYVPSVIICAYFVALFALWDAPRWRRTLIVLAPLVACYVAASYSTLAIAMAGAGALVLAVARWRQAAAPVCAALIVTVLAGYLYYNRDASPMRQKFERSERATDVRLSLGPSAGVSRSLVEAVPGPMQVRLHYWKLFAAGILESAHAAFFGHAQAIDRSVAPSAHNYYLDFVYNFGVLAFLPFLWLAGWTLARLWRLRSLVWRELPLLGLAAAVLYALFLDSVFKVPLRQPYPGIFFFFLWGLLIAQLQSARGAAR